MALITQLKGRVLREPSDAAIIFAPYIPGRVVQSWQSTLHWSYQVHQHSLEKLNRRMQSKYPGNYVVEEFYDKDLRKDVRLKFHSEKDETLFHLRWG